MLAWPMINDIEGPKLVGPQEGLGVRSDLLRQVLATALLLDTLLGWMPSCIRTQCSKSRGTLGFPSGRKMAKATYSSKGLTWEYVAELQSNFDKDKKNQLALNAAVKYGPEEILHCRRNQELTSHIFNHKVLPGLGQAFLFLLITLQHL